MAAGQSLTPDQSRGAGKKWDVTNGDTAGWPVISREQGEKGGRKDGGGGEEERPCTEWGEAHWALKRCGRFVCVCVCGTRYMWLLKRRRPETAFVQCFQRYMHPRCVTASEFTFTDTQDGDKKIMVAHGKRGLTCQQRCRVTTVQITLHWGTLLGPQ